MDDSVVRRRQIEVISLINEEAKGWVVPDEVLHPPDVLENVPWEDESMSVKESVWKVSEARCGRRWSGIKNGGPCGGRGIVAHELPVRGVDDEDGRVVGVKGGSRFSSRQRVDRGWVA